MVYRGLARNGVIVLDNGATLPDGAIVTVQFTDLDLLNPTPDKTYPHAPDSDHRSENVDRLLGILRHSTSEGMRAQQHLDRHL